MNILIAYASKSGTTKDAAELLGAHFSLHNVSYADLATEMPRVENYDVIVVGSYVRAGKIAKTVAEFLKKNREAILARPFGLYLCCNFTDKAVDYFKANMDEGLWQKAASAMCFGGEIRLERQKGMDKLIMKIVLHFIVSHNRDQDREADIPLPALIPENISRFADELKSRL